MTVSERGRIAIPAKARRDLGIAPGDKLLVLGDPQQGIALMTVDRLMENLQGSSALLSVLREHVRDDENARGDENVRGGGARGDEETRNGEPG